MRKRLTKKVILAIKAPEKGQLFVRDQTLPGFGLRVTAAGKKGFILERRILGRPRRLTIGEFGPLGVEDARKMAEKMVAAIAEGRDPSQEVYDRHHEASFAKLIELYETRHVPRKKSGWADKGAINKYLHHWKNRRLSAIKRKDVSDLHFKISEEVGPFAANRVQSLVRKMFNLGKTWGLSIDNPAIGIERFPEASRDRFVSPVEMPTLMAAIKQEPNGYLRAFFLLLLLTGARKDELRKSKWADFDLAGGLWRIGETKTGQPRYIPLPRPAVEILQAIPMQADNEFVFSGQNGKPIGNVQRAWERIRTQAGLKDVRIHDLRRTTASWLVGAGESLPLVGKLLGHSSPGATAVYARMALSPVRRALEETATQMLLIGAGNDSI